MNIFRKLNERIQEIFNPMPLHEMSKAFSYKNRRIDVCAWVENPMGVDNQYFKYYNCSSIPSATKVARIRINKAEYVGGFHRERNLKKWILSNREKQELVEILKMPSERYKNCTNWQDILITYNYDNFDIIPENTIAGNISKYNKDPKMPKHLKPLDINTPMPNYLEL